MTTVNEQKIDWKKYQSKHWTAEKIGDSILGRILAMREERGLNENDVVVLVLLTADGDERDVWCSPVDLSRKVAALEPTVGQDISIEFIAEKPTPRGNPAKLFDVRIVGDASNGNDDGKPF